MVSPSPECGEKENISRLIEMDRKLEPDSPCISRGIGYGICYIAGKRHAVKFMKTIDVYGCYSQIIFITLHYITKYGKKRPLGL